MVDKGGHRVGGCQDSREMLHWEMEEEKGYMRAGLGREVENATNSTCSLWMSRLLLSDAGSKLCSLLWPIPMLVPCAMQGQPWAERAG